MDAWTSFVISTLLALASLFFNVWQYHVYTKRMDSLRGSMGAWWEWARSMREHIDMYWDAVGHNSNADKLAGLAKGTIDGLAKGTARLNNNIQKTMIAAGFPDPGERPWMKRQQVEATTGVKQAP